MVCPLGGLHRANGSGKALTLHDERILELEAELEHAEARVAELERMGEFWHNLAWLHVPHDIIERKLKDPGSLLPPDMARERGE